MTGQVNKKRHIQINGKHMRVQSRRITLCESPEIKAGKAKINDVWYIFELETGRVIFQALAWTHCLEKAKEIVKHMLDQIHFPGDELI